MDWWFNRGIARGVARGVMLIGVGCIATAGIAATPAPDANRKAYDYALRCYVAGAVTASDKQLNPAGAKDAALDAASKRAFDAAYIMGDKLGLSKPHISADFDAYGRIYQRLYLKDQVSFAKARSDCTKLGLM